MDKLTTKDLVPLLAPLIILFIIIAIFLWLRIPDRVEMKTEKTFHIKLMELQRHPSKTVYSVDGQIRPTLYLKQGKKYRFVVDAPGHPLYLTSSALGGKGVPDSLSSNVDERGMVSDNGDLYVVLEREAEKGVLYYQSTMEEGVGGQIVLI